MAKTGSFGLPRCFRRRREIQNNCKSTKSATRIVSWDPGYKAMVSHNPPAVNYVNKVSGNQ